MRYRMIIWIALLVAEFGLFSACTIPGINSLSNLGSPPTSTSDASTPVLHPSPTSDYITINSPVCKMAEWDATLIESVQGDMMAWSPKSDDLAFLAQKSTSWYVGDLSIAAGPDFSQVSDPIPDQSVYGDVTWAPDGSEIAFVALRNVDNLYTVIIVQPDGKGLRDLFPGKTARTDSFASPKSILDWPSMTLLEVELTCGTDCMQTDQLDVQNGSTTLSANTRRAKDRLGGTIKRHVLNYDPKSYPTMVDPNWSEDGKRVVYTTEDGQVWVIDTAAVTRYPVDSNRAAVETKWSVDGKYLAVRTSRWVTVYAWGGCPAQVPGGVTP